MFQSIIYIREQLLNAGEMGQLGQVFVCNVKKTNVRSYSLCLFI